MKNAVQILRAISLMAVMLSCNPANAQVKRAPDDLFEFSVDVESVAQTAPNKLEFDVYLWSFFNLDPFELAYFQFGWFINSGICNGGTLSLTYSNANSGLLPIQQLNEAPIVVNSVPGYPGLTLLEQPGRTPPGAGNGTVISSPYPGTLMAHYILTSSVPFTAGSRPNLIFTESSSISPVYPTHIDTYNRGVYYQQSVNPGETANICASCNPVLNSTPPPPVAYAVTGSGSYCQGGSGLTVGLANSQVGVTYTLFKNNVAQVPTVAGTGASINFGNQFAGTYTVRGFSTPMLGSAVITMDQMPAAAGSIAGAGTFTPGITGIAYSVGTIANASSYIWSYSGTGVTINGTGKYVTLDFSLMATGGQLKVKGHSACGEGAESSVEIQPDSKVLNLSSVFLEGLYNGSGIMRQAKDESGAHFDAPVADQITIELHDAANYANIIYTASAVNLSTSGTATVIIPVTYNDSYYVTIRHRNSIETTTATSISFAGGTINKSFGLADVYAGNLNLTNDGWYVIFAGDINQDGIIDIGDMTPMDNDNNAYASGYLLTDVNGDGIIDSSDMSDLDNNAKAYISSITP
jgi:hypothetical protein